MASHSVTRFHCDICGVICIIFIYFIIIYTDYAFVQWIIIPSDTGFWSSINIFCYQMVLLLLIFSHVKAVTSDPGVIPQPRYGLDFSAYDDLIAPKGDNTKSWSICAKCEMYRPPRAHHCRVCKRCIRKMDHHCPWINNCVGELNQKYFLQFLFYTGIACVYTLIFVMFAFFNSKNDSQQKILHTILLFIESLLFGLFVFAVLSDQLHAIFNCETTIERFQNTRVTPSKPKKQLLGEVFGRKSIYWWFIPCQCDKHRNDHFIV